MSVKVTGFDDLLKKLDKLSDKAKVDAIAKKAVDAAKDTVASSMRSAISASEYGARSTGSVAASVVPTVAKVNSYGAYSVAKPNGMHPSGKRNGEVAAYLNYGSRTMSARPWRAKACSSAEAPATKIMEEVLKSEMDLD